jgi:hypothetical protein
MSLEFKVGRNLGSNFDDLKNFLFKNGKLPSEKELKKFSKQIEDITYLKGNFMYLFSGNKKSVSEIKKVIEKYKYKKHKENFILKLSYFYNSDSVNFPNSFPCGIVDKIYFYYMVMNKKQPITLTELYEIFEGKISKSFINSIMNVLSITEADRKIVEKLLKKNKLYYHRILGKNGFQFTENELKEMIKDPRFSAKSYNGAFSSDETTDIQCRRAVLLHQEACTAEIVMEMLSQTQSEREKSKFINTLSRSDLQEKFKDDAGIQLLMKLY